MSSGKVSGMLWENEGKHEFVHVTMVSDDDENVIRCLWAFVKVEKKDGWEEGRFG